MYYPALLSSFLDNLASFPLLLPQGCLVATLGVVLLLASWLPQYQHYWLRPVALAGLALAGGSQYWLGVQLAGRPAVHLCGQLLVLDPLALFFCWLFLGITVLWVLWACGPAHPTSDPPAGPIHVVLVLGVLLGSCWMVMSAHWLSIYLGLALLSLSTAVLIASSSPLLGASAGLKYLLYSMVASAAMLWGMGYFYGFTGTLVLALPGQSFGCQALPGGGIAMLLLLCLSSILLVLGAAPYHFWQPGVYQGARPGVVAYLATVPKLAAVAVLWRLFQYYLPQLGPVVQIYAQQGLAILALLTLIVGHTGALLQHNLQRLLAYGAIAQGGLLMAGIAAFPSSEVGLQYYSVLYGIASLAAWLGLEALRRWAGSIFLQDCAGLGWQAPGLGVSITVVMMALVGLPPTAGFLGKWLLFTGLWSHARHTGSFLDTSLLVASLVGTVFSLYYYLKLPYVLFAKPASKFPKSFQAAQATSTVVGLLAMLLLLAFATSSLLLSLINA